jgi:hypothetical protein
MALSRELVEDDQRTVRYLLGLLPEDEAEALDEASILDDDFAARLGSVEDDLIDGYIHRTLDRDTLARFEAVYLTSPRRRARVEFGQRFLAAVDARPERSAATGVLRRFAAAAMVALTCGSLLLGYLALRHPGGEPERAIVVARHEPEVPPAVPKPGEPAEVLLFPQTRGGDELPHVAVAPATDRVRFVLHLNANDFSRYEAAVHDAGKEGSVWRSGALPASTKSGRPVVFVDIPAGVLSGPRSTLELRGLDDRGRTEAVASYAFAVDWR